MGDLTIKDGGVSITEQGRGVTFPDRSCLTSANTRVAYVSSAAGIVTIDWSKCDVARISLTENTVFIFKNAHDGQQCLLEITQHASAAKTTTMPANMRLWSGATAWSVTATAGLRDKIWLTYNQPLNVYDVITIQKGYAAS